MQMLIICMDASLVLFHGFPSSECSCKCRLIRQYLFGAIESEILCFLSSQITAVLFLFSLCLEYVTNIQECTMYNIFPRCNVNLYIFEEEVFLNDLFIFNLRTYWLIHHRPCFIVQ